MYFHARISCLPDPPSMSSRTVSPAPSRSAMVRSPARMVREMSEGAMMPVSELERRIVTPENDVTDAV